MELKQQFTEIDFTLINMNDIRDEVRKIAVSWAEANKYDWIGDKHKLASDIQNYADWYANKQNADKYSEGKVTEIIKKVLDDAAEKALKIRPDRKIKESITSINPSIYLTK